jgi:hypothetical protein
MAQCVRAGTIETLPEYKLDGCVRLARRGGKMTACIPDDAIANAVTVIVIQPTVCLSTHLVLGGMCD